MRDLCTPLLSVVIPCRNAGKHLLQCAQSIARQEVALEAIFVDDASSDAVFDALAEEEKARPEFLFLKHDRQRGVSGARNTGLDAARGKYVMFCDADDFFAPDLCKTLLAALEKDLSDIAACPLVRGNEIFSQVIDLQQKTPVEKYLDSALPSIHFNSVCNKLYRKEKIDRQHLRFDETLVTAEDMLFNVSYLVENQSISLVDNSFYHYRETPGSLTSAETAEAAHSFVAAATQAAALLAKKNLAPAAGKRLLTDAWLTTLRAPGFSLRDSRELRKQLPVKIPADGRFSKAKNLFLRLAARFPAVARLLLHGRMFWR